MTYRLTLATLLAAGLLALPVAADPCYRPVKKIIVADPVIIAVPAQINLFQWIAPPTVAAPVLATIAATPAQPSAPPPLVAPDDGLPVALLPGQRSPDPAARPALPVGELVQQYMTGACMRCHGGGVTKGGVSLFDALDAYAPNVPKKQIVDAVASGRMPSCPGCKAVPAKTKELFARWANEP